jgi:hypothetical protein
MDVIEALEQKRRELHELQEHRGQLAMVRADVDAQIADITRRIAESEQDERVLRRVAAQYNLPTPQDGPLLPREVAEWQQLPRTAAVERVLVEAGRPLSPLGIAQVLAEKGRNDSAHHVSAALARLKDTQRANRLGGGKWAAPRHQDSEGAGPASDGDVRPLTGMELIERQLGPGLRLDGDAT